MHTYDACVRGTHIIVCMWRLEDNFLDSVLSSTVGFGSPTQASTPAPILFKKNSTNGLLSTQPEGGKQRCLELHNTLCIRTVVWEISWEVTSEVFLSFLAFFPLRSSLFCSSDTWLFELTRGKVTCTESKREMQLIPFVKTGSCLHKEGLPILLRVSPECVRGSVCLSILATTTRSH